MQWDILLGIHEGRDVRAYDVHTVTIAKFSPTHGLPYFLTNGAPRAHLRRAELRYNCHFRGSQLLL